MKKGAYKFEESSRAYMGGSSGSKGKGKFNDIINTKVTLKRKSSVGTHWGKWVEDRFDKKNCECV